MWGYIAVSGVWVMSGGYDGDGGHGPNNLCKKVKVCFYIAQYPVR